VFTKFNIQIKPAGKRTWKTEESWDGYILRDSTIKIQPELPNDVREEALTELIKLCSVKTASEYWSR